MRYLKYVLISLITILLFSVFALAADDDTQWINISLSPGSINQSTGAEITNSNQMRSGYLAVDPVYTYELDGLAGSVRVFYYDSDMTLLRSALSTGGALSIAEGVSYIRLAGNTANFGSAPRFGTSQGGFAVPQLVTQIVQGALSWIIVFCSSIVEHKLLLLFVIVAFVGLGIGLIRRIIRV